MAQERPRTEPCGLGNKWHGDSEPYLRGRRLEELHRRSWFPGSAVSRALMNRSFSELDKMEASVFASDILEAPVLQLPLVACKAEETRQG